MKSPEMTADLAEYLNGTLGEPECKAIEAAIASDPELQEEYELLSALRQGLKSSEAQLPANDGFDQVMARIRQTAPRALRVEVDEPDGWLARLNTWLFRPALSYAVAGGVILAQFGVIAVLVKQPTPEYTELRTQPIAPAPVGPFIRLSLNPEAKEADIRFLLVAIGASIVGGPTQLGDYYLYVPADRADWAAQQLRQSPITDRVGVIATLPPAKD